jgi:MOSC domain-containing protein
MRVAALFRYPVKGFTREECDALEILPGGRIAGDRVLGLRFNDSTTADDAWGTKLEFVALVNTPGLTALRLKFDHETRRLRIQLADEVLFDDVLDTLGRKRFASTIEHYVLGLEENPISSCMERVPLRVVGDGITSRYQDREPGYTTLHGRRSLAALANAVAEAPELSENRFRSNIAVDGLDTWEEQGWIGRNLRIGDVEFKAVAPVTRCLATHAHPITGKRDLPIMKTLLQLFPSERPTFAIMMTADRGGQIRVGDKVELCD